MKRLVALLLVAFLGFTVADSVAAREKSSSIVTIGGEQYYIHTVEKGETLYSLARKYDLSEEEVQQANPQTLEGLQVGQTLKLPVNKSEKKLSKRQERRLFNTHKVNQGETLYSISRRYEIPVTTLIEDNEGLDPVNLSIGQTLRIRKKDMGDASQQEIEEQLEEYTEALNKVTDSVTYHLVQEKETVYGLSRHYGVTEEELLAANNIRSSDIKVGQMLVIPIAKPTLPQLPEGGDEGKVDEELLWGGERDRDEEDRYVGDVTIRDLSSKSVINVALLLPLKADGSRISDNFLDYYQGTLLALEDLKKGGVSVRLSLYNTANSVSEVESIIRSSEFDDVDLIIGPVYEDGLRVVTRFAEKKGIAVVSPLATIERLKSPVLYQVAPDDGGKYDKLKSIIGEAENVIYISTDKPNQEYDEMIKPKLPVGAKVVTWARGMDLERYLNKKGTNVVIVSCVDEFTVDVILASISSMHNNLVARSISQADIRVIGSSHWARFHRDIDKDLYFKLKVTYVTSYHADRGDIRVNEFDRRFVSAYGSLPTLYSYRGYDVTKLFVGAAKKPGRDFTEKLNSRVGTPLQMRYNFVERSSVASQSAKTEDGDSSQGAIFDRWGGAGDDFFNGGGEREGSERTRDSRRYQAPTSGRSGYVNNERALVQYNSNYTIEVK